MLRSDQIRCWLRLGLCSLVCCGFAIAQTETSDSPKKPAQTSAPPPATAKNSGAQATSKPASSSNGSSKATTHASSHASSHTATHTSHTTSAQKSKSSHGKKGSKQVAKKHGQQAIDSDRARQIQTALIREHYMEGEPTGTWDAITQAAMQRYQADQGWQSKTTPDSRALIKLGLGPSHDHLLNPENAMTTAPAAADPKAATKPAPAQSNPQQ